MALYITSEDMQYLRLLKGHAIRRSVPKNIIANDANILKYQKALNDGMIGLEQFLIEVVTRDVQTEMEKTMENEDSCLQAYADDDEVNFMNGVDLRNDYDNVGNNEKTIEENNRQDMSRGDRDQKIEKKRGKPPKNMPYATPKQELKIKRGRPSEKQSDSRKDKEQNSILKPELKRKRGRPSKKHFESEKVYAKKRK